MYDDLLIIFSNYNGMRTKNDITDPRIKVTIDSFKEKVPYYSDLNVLLLDNNSDDGSDDLLEQMANDSGPKWIFRKKHSEDYYLGTLYHLLHEYKDKFKYMMVVDNDQFFVRSDFITTSMNLFEKRSDLAVVHLNEITHGDTLDSSKNINGLAGFFDEVVIENNEACLLSHEFRSDVEGLKKRQKCKGLGQMIVSGSPARRICWQWFGYANLILRIDKIIDVFDNEELKLPYIKNADRLALFSSTVRDVGRTVFLAKGASINFGFRKYIKKDFSIKELIKNHDQNHKSWYEDDAHSFFVKNGKLTSIEREIESAKKKNNL